MRLLRTGGAALVVAALAIPLLPASNAAVVGPVRCLDRMDAFGYTCSAIPFAFEDISDTGACILGVLDCLEGDDVISRSFDLPFAFPFYGETHSAAYVTTNGLLVFDNTGDNAEYTPYRPPSPQPGQGFIAGHWSDLQAVGPGHIVRELRGTGADERLIVQWNEVGLCCGTVGMNTFQIKLFADGRIEVHQDEAYSRGMALVGLENSREDMGIAAAFDAAYHSDLAWSFTPPADPRPASLRADLYIEYLDGPAALLVGESDVVRFLMSNHKPEPGLDARVTVTIPANIEVDRISNACTLAARMVRCLYGGNIHDFGSDTIRIEFTALRPGAAVFRASVAGATPDFDSSDNRAAWTVQVGADLPDVLIDLSGAPWYGDHSSGWIDVAVRNVGSQDALDVAARVTLPPSLAIDTVPGGCVAVLRDHVCTVGTLAAGSTESFSFEVHAKANGRATVMAAATSSSIERGLANNRDRLSAPLYTTIANVGVSLSGLATFVEEDDASEHFLTVSNAGPDAATAVLVRLPVPADLPYFLGHGVSFSTPDVATCTQSLRMLTCRIATLGSGESLDIGFHLMPPAPTVRTLVATVDARQPDPSTGNDRATAAVYVLPAGSLG